MAALAPSAEAITLQAANSPENNQTLAIQAIRAARQSLLINLYEFTEPNLADALEERIRAGVHVEILQEGHPVGGLSAAGRGIQSRLIRAIEATTGTSDRYFQMDPPADGKRRFRFDHAKYMVIDGGGLWIASENFSPSGMPVPGTVGNRGWSTFIQDSAISDQFSAMFRSDTRTDFGDITLLAGQAIRKGYRAFFAALGEGAPADPVGVIGGADLDSPGRAAVPGNGRIFVPPVGSFPVLQAGAVSSVHSPDTSLSGLLALINSATRTLDVQQMSLYSDWKALGRTSPLVEGLVSAARRGVRVRVLLNDESAFFNHPPTPEQNSGPGRPCEDPDLDGCDPADGLIPGLGNSPSGSTRERNRETVNLLLETAAQEHLPIDARIADLKAMGAVIIHNKGMIVDGRRVLVSSINWNENSVTRNREAGVAIDSVQTASYFGSLFERDWQASAAKARLESRNHLSALLTSVPCPDRLRSVARVGTLKSDGDHDPSFEELSGRVLTDHFVRDPAHSRGDECVMRQGNEPSGTLLREKRFLQIRATRNGTFRIALEGYTSAGKLFSVRVASPVVDVGQIPDGSFAAQVFDASGVKPHHLGRATLELVSE